MAAELNDERVSWLNTTVHSTLKFVIREFHDLLFFRMLEDMGYEDTELQRCLEQWFPYMGTLEPSHVNTKAVKQSVQEVVTEHELRKLRGTLSQRALSKLKPSDHSQQVIDKMLGDYLC